MMRINFLYFFFFIFHTLLAQDYIIKGIISESSANTPVYFASIILKKTNSNTILSYTYSKENGYFILNCKEKGNYNLTISSIGYITKTIPISIENKHTSKNIILDINTTHLDEVILNVEKPIIHKKDTIEYKSDYFAKGTETNVEDLLKNIPGVHIAEDGKISVKGREIEKLMVDGDDFFEKGYRLLSKNMPSYTINKVQLLDNYSENHLLKDIKTTKDVAINLTLKKESKNIWFGNIKLGLGNNNFYEGVKNVMKFRTKNKFYFLSNANNIGTEASKDINFLLNPSQKDIFNTVNLPSLQKTFNLRSYNINFNGTKNIFNNTKLTSLNGIFNINKKIKIKTTGLFNWDKKQYFNNTTYTTLTNNSSFTNNEIKSLNNKENISLGRLTLIYNPNKKTYIKATTQFNKNDFNNYSNTEFNTLITEDNLTDKNEYFYQKISISNKITKNTLISGNATYVNEKSPQNYTTNLALSEIFPEFLTTNNYSQNISQKMTFSDINSGIIHKRKNNNLVEFHFGNKRTFNQLKSNFTLLQDSQILANPSLFQNDVNLTYNNFYLTPKYTLNFKKIKFTTGITFKNYFNTFISNNLKEEKNESFINPNIDIDIDVNKNNSLRFSYELSNEYPNIIETPNNSIITNNRSYNKGLGFITRLKKSTFFLIYRRNPLENNTITGSIYYTKDHNYITNNSFISQNYTLTESVIKKNQESLRVNSDLNFYFKYIKSNLKINLIYSKHKYANLIDNITRNIKSNNYTYGLQLKSGFKGIFNYTVGSIWNASTFKTSETNTTKNNKSFVDIYFNFSEKLNLKINNDSYFFENIHPKKIYYFSNLDLNYTIIPNKLSINLIGNNLFNVQNYTISYINDTSTFTSEYRLLPRHGIIKLEYRF